MNNVCNLRPSNGKQCAIDFGKAYAKDHGRRPSHDELAAHLHLSEYSYQWQEVLRIETNRSADRVLATSDHPEALKGRITKLQDEKDFLRGLLKELLPLIPESDDMTHYVSILFAKSACGLR